MCAVDCPCVNYYLAEYISRKVHTELGLKKLPGTTTGFSDTTFRCYGVGQVAENNPRQYDAQPALTKHYKPGHIFPSSQSLFHRTLRALTSSAQVQVQKSVPWQPGHILGTLLLHFSACHSSPLHFSHWTSTQSLRLLRTKLLLILLCHGWEQCSWVRSSTTQLPWRAKSIRQAGLL